MKILLSGGGTLGPVTPLLALVEYWRDNNEAVDIVWVGTKNGPEGELVEASGVRFISINSVKVPRYLTFYWLGMPFLLIRSFFDAWKVLRVERPDVIVTAGGYVSVPLVVLGWMMGVKSWVHQQDVVPGLANKIMARFASKISVTFDQSKEAFKASKTTVTGNAVRPSMLLGDRGRGLARYGLDADRATIVVIGGGGGSAWINDTVSALAENLAEKWQVLHITGASMFEFVQVDNPHYVVVPIVNERMEDVYAMADLVICRAGLGTMTELVHVCKPAIVIPIPDSHQEMNAYYLYENQAAIILDQTETTPQIMLSTIRHVISNQNVAMRLCANLKLSFPRDGTKEIAEGVLGLARESDKSWKRGDAEVERDALPEVMATIEDMDDDIPLSIKEQIARAMNSGVEIECDVEVEVAGDGEVEGLFARKEIGD